MSTMFRDVARKVCELFFDFCGYFVSGEVGNSNTPRNNESNMGRSRSPDVRPAKRPRRLQDKGGGSDSASASATDLPRLTRRGLGNVAAVLLSRRTPYEPPVQPPSSLLRLPRLRSAPALTTAIGGTANIGYLPPELLLEVFSHLNVQQLEASVAPVCRLWRELSRRTCLRRELALDGCGVDTSTACEMLRGCPQLAQLLIASRADAEPLLRAVALYNHELRRLAIVRCNGSSARPYLAAHILNKLLLRCPKLVDLTIKHSTFRSNKFFHDLGSLLPELRKLNLNYSSSFGSDALKMIALHCGKLEEIRALRRRSPNSTVPHCSDQDVWLVAKRLSATLRVLKIDGAMLSDDGMDALAQCSELRTLCVRHAFSVTDWGVAHLTKLRRLESLDLTGMGVVSPAGWCRLFSECSWSQLRGLSLALCLTVNDDVLREVARVCPGLVKISFACCMFITKAGLSAVIQACAGLESINLCPAPVYVFSSFVSIPTYTPGLKRLVYHPYGFEEEKAILKFLQDTLPDLDIVRGNN